MARVPGGEETMCSECTEAVGMVTGPAPLSLADLAACLKLDQQALGGLWTESQWRTELQEASRPGVGLWQGEALVAMACGWLILDELHITVVAVDPQWRRLGLGQQVLAALLAEARGRAASRATLEVATGNGAARGLYARFGFRDAGIRRGYYRSGEDALIQWLDLRT
ncbi:ribosomal protein S18-alanine N-acetyltransferase [Synechococcus sp. CBW1006]|uniref:ribosomal protein S18-alanine N-acetyltransferase n=1 Tax=Synechococcus sp. CBW1006 TaxID=1353138 RepID=UPI00351C6B5A